MNKQYCYSFDDEYYVSDLFDTREEAIEAAKKEWNDNNYENDYPEKIIHLAEAFLYEDDFNSLTNTLLCEIQERANWENEYAESYMCLTFDHREILVERLKKMIKNFQKEFGYQPNFYNIERLEQVKF